MSPATRHQVLVANAMRKAALKALTRSIKVVPDRAQHFVFEPDEGLQLMLFIESYKVVLNLCSTSVESRPFGVRFESIGITVR